PGRLGARLRPRPGARPGRRAGPRRLPDGRQRPARLDARRGAAALRPGVLPRLVGRLRRGTAADVRARPGGEGADTVEGTAGAGRAVDRPGLPPGAAGARRAVLGA